jgi:hypothetical protein
MNGFIQGERWDEIETLLPIGIITFAALVTVGVGVMPDRAYKPQMLLY